MIDANRAQGCLLGLACGDALGRPVEFRSGEQITSDHGTLDEVPDRWLAHIPEADELRVLATDLTELDASTRDQR